VRTILHAAAITLALQCGAGLTTHLVAQGAPGAGTPTNPACELLTDQEIDAATGVDYDEADPVDDPSFRAGTSSCLWGGASFAPGASRPQLGVMRTQMLPTAVNAPFPAAPPRAGCTREDLRGIGDKAYLDTCEKSRGPMAYVKVGRNRLMLQLDPERGKPLASAKPALIALAKAAAARAKEE
jgi:hypothetical protein